MNGFIVLIAGNVGTDRAWQQAWLVGTDDEGRARHLVESAPGIEVDPQIFFVGVLTADHGLKPGEVRQWM